VRDDKLTEIINSQSFHKKEKAVKKSRQTEEQKRSISMRAPDKRSQRDLKKKKKKKPDPKKRERK